MNVSNAQQQIQLKKESFKMLHCRIRFSFFFFLNLEHIVLVCAHRESVLQKMNKEKQVATLANE